MDKFPLENQYGNGYGVTKGEAAAAAMDKQNLDNAVAAKEQSMMEGIAAYLSNMFGGPSRLAQSNMSAEGDARINAEFAKLAAEKGFVPAQPTRATDAEYAAMEKMIADNRYANAAKRAIEDRNYIPVEADMEAGWAGTGPIDAIANTIDQYSVDKYNDSIDPGLAALWQSSYKGR